MKRLKLDDFKLKSLNRENEKNAQKLLGQVLGDCHDEPYSIMVMHFDHNSETGEILNPR